MGVGVGETGSSGAGVGSKVGEVVDNIRELCRWSWLGGRLDRVWEHLDGAMGFKRLFCIHERERSFDGQEKQRGRYQRHREH